MKKATRQSNSKVIKDQESFSRLFPAYKKILDSLMKEFPVSNGNEFEDLVNFKDNRKIAKHNWFEYKQGYADALVRTIIEKNPINKDQYVLDPFSGVGTTCLTAQSMGYKGGGFDINPIAILTAECKTHHYTKKEIESISCELNDFKLPSRPYPMGQSKVLSTSFEKDVLQELLKIRAFVEGVEELYVQKFFRLSLISIIDQCSLKVKDGNGLKFKKNAPKIESVKEVFLSKAKKMLEDVRNVNYSVPVQIIFGSATSPETFKKAKEKRVGVCIFSPPYANCFDYCEVYKQELWIGGFVNSYEDFEKYRSLAMRSHVNSKFDHSLTNMCEDVETIAETIRTFNIWNKNIPDMLKGYFDDMQQVLENMKKILVPKAKTFIVVANSAYKGILVPTDLIIAKIAKSIGYNVNKIYMARKIRSSSQQMQLLNESYDDLMRESIIEVQRR